MQQYSCTQWPGDRSKGVAQLAQSTCIVFLDHVQNLHISCSARQNPYEFFLHEYVNFVHGPEKPYSSVSTKIYIFMQCAPKSNCRFSVWGMILNHPFKGWFRCQLCDPCIGPLRAHRPGTESHTESPNSELLLILSQQKIFHHFMHMRAKTICGF